MLIIFYNYFITSIESSRRLYGRKIANNLLEPPKKLFILKLKYQLYFNYKKY